MSKKELIITDDGSHSYFVPEVGENYHSSYGAIQESRHIFIESGLCNINRKEIRIFEMGFGSGLNALLAWDYTRSKNIKLEYESIELFPISPQEASLINYPDKLNIRRDDFAALHECEWDKWHEISSGFTFIKKHIDLLTYIKGDLPTKAFDMVFFDAFSPEAQPELWKTPIFKFLFEAMNPDGILTSYSVRGEFRRSLLSVGFRVEKVPGPPGKRHITRAFK